MREKSFDAVVAGAGIIGAACAWELARSGLRVAVIDASSVGGGATSAGMGHLLVLDDSPIQFTLTKYSLQLWEPLFAELPAACEFWRCGTVWVAEDAEQWQFAARRCEYFNRNGVAAELLTGQELANMEPQLRPGLAGGALVPNDASLVPGMAARFFMERATARGAELMENVRVVEMNDSGVRLSDGARLTAQTYVNAAGTHAPILAPGLPVRSRKGHILVVKPPHNVARHQIVELGYLKSAHASEFGDSVAFNVRHTANGELLIGSSRQYGVEDAAVENHVVKRMLDRAIEFVPQLATVPQVRSWTGFRAGTPDGLPLIGPVPGFERVYAASGHEGLGATTSVATARLLADQILKRPSEIDTAPFLPARFAVAR